MEVKIWYKNGVKTDSAVIKAATPEEINKQSFLECEKRGWEFKNCWNEVISIE